MFKKKFLIPTIAIFTFSLVAWADSIQWSIAKTEFYIFANNFELNSDQMKISLQCYVEDGSGAGQDTEYSLLDYTLTKINDVGDGGVYKVTSQQGFLDVATGVFGFGGAQIRVCGYYAGFSGGTNIPLFEGSVVNQPDRQDFLSTDISSEIASTYDNLDPLEVTKSSGFIFQVR